MMKSYASIELFSKGYAYLEVEMHDVIESHELAPCEKEVRTLAAKLEKFPIFENLSEGDIVIVEHDMENILEVIEKDDIEKERRIEKIRMLKARFNIKI